MKFIFSIIMFSSTLVCFINYLSLYHISAEPILNGNANGKADKCDLLRCDNEKKENLICAASETGSIASFHSECGVNLINCYQRAYNAPEYKIISRKACAHKDILYMRGKCDKLKCDNGEPEKAVCATNGTGTGLFKSACHIEILNCYQKIYARPQYRIVASKNCANIQGWQ